MSKLEHEKKKSKHEEVKKRGRGRPRKDENIKPKRPKSDTESEIESDGSEIRELPRREPTKIRQDITTTKIREVKIMCTDCHNIHTGNLVHILVATEFEIARLKQENDTLKEKIKTLDSIDILKLLSENAQLKSNVIP